MEILVQPTGRKVGELMVRGEKAEAPSPAVPGGGPAGALEPETTPCHGRDLRPHSPPGTRTQAAWPDPCPQGGHPPRAPPPPPSQGLQGRLVPHLPPVLPDSVSPRLPKAQVTRAPSAQMEQLSEALSLAWACHIPAYLPVAHCPAHSQDSHGCREPGGLQLLDGGGWMRPNRAPGLPAASPSPPPSGPWLPTRHREGSNSSLGVHWGHLGELWYPEGKGRTSPEGDVP